MRRGALIALVFPAIALAHAVGHPRRIVLNAAPPSKAGLPNVACIDLVLDPESSARARLLFDRDRDGRISEAESPMLERYLQQRATAGFSIGCGGSPARLMWSGTLKSGPDLAYTACGFASVSWGECVIEDGGDAEGHVPISARNAKVEVDLPKSVGLDGFWDLPAHKPTKFRISVGR